MHGTGPADLESNAIPTAPQISYGGHIFEKARGQMTAHHLPPRGHPELGGFIPSRARAGVPAGDRLNAGASGFVGDWSLASGDSHSRHGRHIHTMPAMSAMAEALRAKRMTLAQWRCEKCRSNQRATTYRLARHKEARVVLSGLVQEEVGKLVADVEGLVASSS